MRLAARAILALMMFVSLTNASWGFQRIVNSRSPIAALSSGSLAFGGVLFVSQAHFVVEQSDGSDQPLDGEIGLQFDLAAGRLCIENEGSCHFLEITEERLGRIASLIDNSLTHSDGVGVFSAYVLLPEQAAANGLTPCTHVEAFERGEFLCALEFAGDPTLEQALYALDFSDDKEFSDETAAMIKLNEGLPDVNDDSYQFETQHWEVSDYLRSPKVRLLANGTVLIESALHKFGRASIHPVDQDGELGEPLPRLFVYYVTELLGAIDIVQSVADPVVDALTSAVLGSPVCQSDPNGELCVSMLEYLADADMYLGENDIEAQPTPAQLDGILLANQVAMLRTVAKEHPDSWRQFTAVLFEE
ncbi:MAG: hypothetical protein SGJ21_13920 [Alphaproteobacteria bacterium]|nr:hypothetical protein [Alphaproteobacteria bacterium]